MFKNLLLKEQTNIQIKANNYNVVDIDNKTAIHEACTTVKPAFILRKEIITIL